MTHSLKDLKAGKLIGLKRLKLACGLHKFPEEILTLAGSLEILDLSDNHMSLLPDSITELKKLKVIFFARNNFKVFPEVLAKCSELSMIGFKSNEIETIPENAFPPKLNWLILTDNKLEKVPTSIGDCERLQKCMLAGNKLKELPVEMSQCKNLELLRISANKLTAIPDWLLNLPKLSWLAFGGNLMGESIENDIEAIDWNDFTIKHLIGEGASGVISEAFWNSRKELVAIKIFKGKVTSDGSPVDEMKLSILAGIHKNLIPILGKISNHPEGTSGLVMKLISRTYINLGNPPSLETCTRDVFDDDVYFTEKQSLKIAKSVASVCAQLHSKGINHGDLYAHNILVNETAECLLGDFGAASFYDINSDLAQNMERIEIRAFGCLLEDVLGLIKNREKSTILLKKWQNIIDKCKSIDVLLRPNFISILEELEGF